jgi:phosphoribosylformimino-5-aminoimidazole carboxamide ribotide isomerase
MRIIPVLDLMGGRVVRGIAGRRAEYRSVESRLVAGHDPVPVAVAIRATFGLNEFYVADLDAIREERVQWEVLRGLLGVDCRLLVDAGIREAALALELRNSGVGRAIAAQETLAGREALRSVLQAVSSDHIVYSLDLQAGRLLGPAEGWNSSDALPRAREAVECGARSLIVLDLAGVGVSAGVATLELCRQIRRALPDVELMTGGGVRGRDDLLRCREAGVDAVLGASALHDGSLSYEDLARATA